MKITHKITSILLIFVFGVTSVLTPNALAQSRPVQSVVSFVPSVPVFKGIKIFPQEPFRFDFLMEGAAETPEEAQKLVKYFMASLTIPEGDLWVNLSPDEPDRIIPEALGRTDMGRDMLAQDYILKQLTAALMHPENETGKKVWEEIYRKAYEQFGTTDIPTETFNRVWIVPDQAVVFQNGDTSYVAKASLKVMLEEDYLQSQQHIRLSRSEPDLSEEIKTVLRSVLIPALEDQVNQAGDFAPLRQLYHSLILAQWFKQNLKASVIGQNYVDHNTVSGIDSVDAQAKDKIYNDYLKLFKQGAYEFIKEEYDPTTQNIVPRKYFSGGVKFDRAQLVQTDLDHLRSLINADQGNVINQVSVNMAMLEDGFTLSRKTFLQFLGLEGFSLLLPRMARQTQRAFSPAPEEVIGNYFNVLNQLSGDLWANAESDTYVESTDHQLGKFIADVKKYPGATGLGVSHQFNFSLAVNGNFRDYIILDFNPVLTEIMLPAFLYMIADAPDRRTFISRILSTEITDDDIRNIFDVRSDQSTPDIQQFLQDIHQRDSEEKKELSYETYLKKVLEALLKNHPHRAQIMEDEKNLARVTSVFEGFFQPKHIFRGGINATMRGFIKEHANASADGYKSWLSTEDNYQQLRRMVLGGHIVAMTADLTDETFPQKVNAWLSANKKGGISHVYPSNVGQWLSRAGGTDLVIRMLENLESLKRSGRTRLLMSGYSLIAATYDLEFFLWATKYVNATRTEIQDMVDTIGGLQEEEIFEETLALLSRNERKQWNIFSDYVKQHFEEMSLMGWEDSVNGMKKAIADLGLSISTDSEVFRLYEVWLIYSGHLSPPDGVNPAMLSEKKEGMSPGLINAPEVNRFRRTVDYLLAHTDSYKFFQKYHESYAVSALFYAMSSVFIFPLLFQNILNAAGYQAGHWLNRFMSSLNVRGSDRLPIFLGWLSGAVGTVLSVNMLIMLAPGLKDNHQSYYWLSAITAASMAVFYATETMASLWNNTASFKKMWSQVRGGHWKAFLSNAFWVGGHIAALTLTAILPLLFWYGFYLIQSEKIKMPGSDMEKDKLELGRQLQMKGSLTSSVPLDTTASRVDSTANSLVEDVYHPKDFNSDVPLTWEQLENLSDWDKARVELNDAETKTDGDIDFVKKLGIFLTQHPVDETNVERYAALLQNWLKIVDESESVIYADPLERRFYIFAGNFILFEMVRFLDAHPGQFNDLDQIVNHLITVYDASIYENTNQHKIAKIAAYVQNGRFKRITNKAKSAVLAVDKVSFQDQPIRLENDSQYQLPAGLKFQNVLMGADTVARLITFDPARNARFDLMYGLGMIAPKHFYKVFPERKLVMDFTMAFFDDHGRFVDIVSQNGDIAGAMVDIKRLNGLLVRYPDGTSKILNKNRLYTGDLLPGTGRGRLLHLENIRDYWLFLEIIRNQRLSIFSNYLVVDDNNALERFEYSKENTRMIIEFNNGRWGILDFKVPMGNITAFVKAMGGVRRAIVADAGGWDTFLLHTMDGQDIVFSKDQGGADKFTKNRLFISVPLEASLQDVNESTVSDTSKARGNDDAMLGKSRQNTGGIDLNMINLETRGQGSSLNLPQSPALLQRSIPALTPQILSITPATLSGFLSIDDRQPAKQAALL